MQPSVRLTNVSVVLNGVRALKNVSVEIPSGKIVGLLGPSGAGKTTLMRVILGRQRVQKGTAEVLGRPAGSAPLRGLIGYMPQSAAIYRDLTVRENIRYFAAMLGVGKRKAESTIAEVRLGKQADQLAATLSGGQKSRLSLAIALLGRPSFLILDEPTVGVDPVLRQELWERFRELVADGSITLLISSHVMDEAARCDDLLLIRNGRLLAHSAPDLLCLQTGAATIEDAFLKLVEARRR